MTNQEKAKEIANYVGRWHRVYGYKEISSKPDCENAALTMAEWKDKQFVQEKHELIKKANESVNQSFENGAKIVQMKNVKRRKNATDTMPQKN